jgi:O-antigen/teichoic acid export membrane protein
MVTSAVAVILGDLCMLFLAYHRQPGLKNDWRNCNWQTFKVLFSFGGVIFLCMLCLTLKETGLKWIMGGLISMSFVAHMAIMVVPVKIFVQVVQAMTLAVMPAASKYDAQQNNEILGELFLRGTRYVTLLAVGAVVTAFFLLKPLLMVWLGDEYRFLGNFMLIIFAAAAFQATSFCAHHILRGMGKLKIALINSIVGQAGLPVGFTLVVYLLWQDPYWAIALGLSLGNVVYGVMQLGFCSRAVKVNYRRLLIHSYAQTFLVAIPVFAVVYLIAHIMRIEDFFLIIAIIIFGLCLSMVLFYVFFFTQKERLLFKELLVWAASRVPFIHWEKTDV